MKTPETIMTIRETCTYQCVLSSTKRCAAVMWLDGSTPATSAVVPKITQIQPMVSRSDKPRAKSEGRHKTCGLAPQLLRRWQESGSYDERSGAIRSRT